ncbi:hypothetical protein [Hydromonas duriensis]|uniref:Uncharacterized protein n=1 Tax=Hydromonas duriensis TaxID=1527608 RepID=A0A4R6Y0V7_9BURK|nr:hypothetical protein [Hydromonas duriensis]TDR28935.1 hypothetical protein DFR44_1304 [Hydromonas duriensis]
MFEVSVSVSLFEASKVFNCIAGLTYSLKESREINGKVAVYAIPHYTLAKGWLVDCTMLDESFEPLECYSEVVEIDNLNEPLLERYIS